MAVLNKLSGEFMPSQVITQERVEDCVKGFERLGFPQCFGAIDIEVHPKGSEATDYYNFKGWHSMVLFALVDYRYRFQYIHVGAPGKCHDAEIFKQCRLKQKIENSDLFIKNSRNICGVDVPVVILGDSALKFGPTLMKPYAFVVAANEQQKTFNYRLSKSRRVVENAFGHLKSRFRRIGKGLDNRVEKWLEDTCIREQPDTEITSGEYDTNAERIRAAIAQSFLE